jgi:cytochrome c-type biogenesis protein CcmE
MKRKQQRMVLIGAGFACLAGAVALGLLAFTDKVTYFYSPSDLAAADLVPGTTVRLGGVVADGSVVQEADGITTSFVVTDGGATVPVRFTGVLPDLFREGQGVIVVGAGDAAGPFVATEVLAKHDENYMPKEVADALKEQGYWQEGEDATQP